ncbi:MAG: hypothetical protein R6X06_08580 [Gammaproteobacteria bacterium]
MTKSSLLICIALCASGCAQLAPPVAESTHVADNSTPLTTNPSLVAPPLEALGTADAEVTELSEVEAPELFGPVTDLWSRIRHRFSLAAQDHPRIDKQLAWYTRHQSYMDRVAERAQPYMHFIVEMLEQEDIPSELALLPIVESAFQPFAYSHGRAAGIW